MSNQQVNDQQYFNLHLEGFANLYNARWIKPKAGQSFDPFLQVRAAYLQGRHDSADPVFVDLKVTGKTARRVIEHYLEAIADGDQKVSAVIKSGDLRFDLKMQPGQDPKLFIGARLLSVKYLKVNGEKVDLEAFAEPGDSAKESPVSGSQSAAGDHAPTEVSLDPEAPDFEAQKTELKGLGYRWDKAKKVWRLEVDRSAGWFEGMKGSKPKPRPAAANRHPMPETVSLDPQDPDFEARKAELKDAGYRWDKAQKLWRLSQQAA